MPERPDPLNAPVLLHARKDFPQLRPADTVEQALAAIREKGVGEKVVYFYVVDEQEHLLGVLPTRRLLTSGLAQKLSEVMIHKVIAIPHTATILAACELFLMHRFLAFPVVDEQRRIVGVVDIGLFTEEVIEIGERERADELFESLGFRISQVRAATPGRAFRLRFPWLLTTISSGTVCALLASLFETTIQRSVILAFFLTLVLALGESVSIQSMAVAVQALRAVRPSRKWFARALSHEAKTAVLLGGGCGLLVGGIVGIWRGFGWASPVIGGSVMLSLIAACIFGLSVPALLHWLRLDPKIAAGPLTLALTDVTTLLVYFGLGALLLA